MCVKRVFRPPEGGGRHHLPAGQPVDAAALLGGKIQAVEQPQRGGAYGTGEAGPKPSQPQPDQRARARSARRNALPGGGIDPKQPAQVCAAGLTQTHKVHSKHTDSSPALIRTACCFLQ